jgi:N-carbamoyl-L-amino-acid hydrolase
MLDEARVMSNLRTLAQFGKLGTGVDRPAFTDADVAARHWLVEQMQDAGLQAAIDGVGNVCGRSANVDRSVLIGSHTDSVPRGGWLDGALGVIFALELARVHRVGIDVVSFADEEGTWLPCLGSRCFCGELSQADLADISSKTGERLLDRLAQLGLRDRPLSRLDPLRHRAYLEAHIEQGPLLETKSIDVGIVTGIVGLRRYVVHFGGRADHAGTTPMSMRRDAAFALFKFATDLTDRLHGAAGTDSVWNFGSVGVRPGAANVVPAEAELTVEFRDLSPAVLARMDSEFHAAVRAADGALDVAVSGVPNGALEPIAMAMDLVGVLGEAATEADASHLRMPSGAGHDAMILARRIPSAMLFVPSIGGRSHDIAEDTSEADIRRGFRVFAAAAAKVIAGL